MIHIKCNIKNPVKSKPFKNLWSKVFRVNENKTLEFQIYKDSYYIFEIEINTYTEGSDHAGPFFELGVLGYYFSVGLPDRRHWNDELNIWEDFKIG